MSSAASPSRAHPRWRGEDVIEANSAPRAPGSSPLARGGRKYICLATDGVRLIPAGAGRTRGPFLPSWAGTAHPRWRGEDTFLGEPDFPELGSSPLARGGRRRDVHVIAVPGLIPAGAGRTAGCAGDGLAGGAHPRWRGEDSTPGMRRAAQWGSSPLARGGRGGSHWCPPGSGLIPAGAGRTHDVRGGHLAFPAHPRWRGEDEPAAVSVSRAKGSSPLARGGHQRCQGPMLLPGLIPAGAGRTTGGFGAGDGPWAHPRWRGEDFKRGLDVLKGWGSSPLARGGRPARELDRVLAGLIPAGAGRTSRLPRRRRRPPAHPRWRGEDTVDEQWQSQAWGSSPLARGGPGRRCPRDRPRRLIPAGAGRTKGPPRRVSRPAAHPRWRGEDDELMSRYKVLRGSSPLARGGHVALAVGSSLGRLIPAGAGRTYVAPAIGDVAGAHPRWRGEDVYGP